MVIPVLIKCLINLNAYFIIALWRLPYNYNRSIILCILIKPFMSVQKHSCTQYYLHNVSARDKYYGLVLDIQDLPDQPILFTQF